MSDDRTVLVIDDDDQFAALSVASGERRFRVTEAPTPPDSTRSP